MTTERLPRRCQREERAPLHSRAALSAPMGATGRIAAPVTRTPRAAGWRLRDLPAWRDARSSQAR